MRVERYAHAEEFTSRAGELLTRREAEHNLILGLCDRLRSFPRLYGEDPYFAVVVERGRIEAAALRTPPHNLLISEVDDDRAIEPLCDDARAAFGELPGVLGPKEAVARFARSWEASTGVRARVATTLRIYRAETATLPDGVDGRMRWYDERDRALVISWFDAFIAEAMHETELDDAASLLERRVTEPEGGIVLWEDGSEAVSLAGFGGTTPNGIRVGPVYTPPERRRRGYASALVAQLTQELLDGGRRFCFLFTDLANQTSNAIYQQVGYRAVTDVDEWLFSPPRRPQAGSSSRR
jgi:predicted GNAT family acetyltransferase